jgi:hypothetical protein
MKNWRKLLFLTLLLLMVFTGYQVSQPQETAHACLPCTCPVPNPPVNCFGPYTVFLHRHESGGFDLEILIHDGAGNRERVMYFTKAQLARIKPDPNPDTHILVRQAAGIYFFKLSWGDYQINVGPDAEKKIYWVIIDDENGSRVNEGDYVSQAP